MNKYAEIQKIAVLYAACRGILRVKLAATTNQQQQPAANNTAQQPAANNTAQQPAANNQQQNPQQQQSGMGGIFRDLGNTAESAITGQAGSGTGAWVGDMAATAADKGYDAATGWLAKQKGWMGAAGKFLQGNKDKIGNVVAGANQYMGWTKGLQDQVNANNMQKQMTAQQQEQANQQFNPDAMFAGMFQNFANVGNNMAQPSQYAGSTYRPSFA